MKVHSTDKEFQLNYISYISMAYDVLKIERKFNF